MVGKWPFVILISMSFWAFVNFHNQIKWVCVWNSALGFKSLSPYFLALVALDRLILTSWSLSSVTNTVWIVTLTMWVGRRTPDNVNSTWQVAGFSVGDGWHSILNQNSPERSNLQGKLLRSYALNFSFLIFIFTSAISKRTGDLHTISFIVGAHQDVYIYCLWERCQALSVGNTSNNPIKCLRAPCNYAVEMWFTEWLSTLQWPPWETSLSDLNISNNCLSSVTLKKFFS